MSTNVMFTMKIEPELRDTFMAEATADDRPADQVVRELMRDYINRRREAREYDEFLRRKVEIARASMRAGVGIPQEEVEAEARLQALIAEGLASGSAGQVTPDTFAQMRKELREQYGKPVE